MLRMVGDPALAMVDGSRCSLLGDPFPSKGGYMLRMVGNPRHNHLIFRLLY